jgi:xanthine dehydrogenase small subunit
MITRRWQVNGAWRSITAPPLEPLLHVLRNRLRVTGPKEGCGEGECGACTVLLNDQPVTACLVAAGSVPDGSCILTAEGIVELPLGRAIAESFTDHGAVQCGICFPGMLASAYAHLRDAGRGNPSTVQRESTAPAARAGVTEAGVREALSGNLCRCTGYAKIIAAVLEVAGKSDTWEEASPAPPGGEAHPGGGTTEASSSAQGSFFAPITLDEALAYRSRHPGCGVLAGGTDLMVALQAARARPLFGEAHPDGQSANPATPAWPDQVLALGAVGELRGIATAEEGLRIGATTTAETIARDARVRACAPALQAAARLLGARQIRQLATIGGNIVNASPAADLVPPLLAAGATLVVASARGQRNIPLARFYRGYKDVDLAPDELLVAIHVPALGAGEREGFRKLGTRQAQSISKVAAAVRLRLAGEVIVDAAVALASVAPTPVRLPRAEAHLSGRTFTPELVDAIPGWVEEEVAPITDVRSTAAYRRTTAGVLVVDLVTELTRR